MATKVRQLVPSVGTDFVREAGQEYVTDDDEAARLFAAGIAEPVVPPTRPPVETASKAPPERRRGKRGG